MFVGTYLNLRFKAVQRGLEWGYDFFYISNKIYQCTAWLEEFYFETQKKCICISNGKTAFFKIDLTASVHTWTLLALQQFSLQFMLNIDANM